MSSLWGAASGSQSTGARRQRQCPWLDLLPLCSFVMINSVALEGDGCDICSRAEAELLEISHWLNCSREVGQPPTPAPLWGHGHPCFPLPPTIQCPVSEEPGL